MVAVLFGVCVCVLIVGRLASGRLVGVSREGVVLPRWCLLSVSMRGGVQPSGVEARCGEVGCFASLLSPLLHTHPCRTAHLTDCWGRVAVEPFNEFVSIMVYR